MKKVNIRQATIVLLLLQCTLIANALVESVASNVDGEYSHFQPMVAFLCGHGKFHNQYLNEQRQWVTDYDPSATCIKDKLEMLEYCRKVYPKKDIRNIVESNRYYRIDNWQTVFGRSSSHHSKANRQHYVKPIRCLEGSFQSDALLVPEHCLFDHIHNNSVCESTSYWNRTASHSCQGKGKILESYAMLLPCGVGIFSGVEFVCCPHPMADQSRSNAGHSRASVSSSVQAYARNAPEVKELGDRSAEDAVDVESTFGESSSSQPAPKSRKNGKKIVTGVSTKIRLENEKYANEDTNEDDDDGDDDSSSDENDNEDAINDEIKNEDNRDSIRSKNSRIDSFDSKRKNNKKTIKQSQTEANDENDDDDFYDDEYEEKEDENGSSASSSSSTSTTTTTTTTTTTETPLEHYYSHFDAKNEHQQYKMAEKALKELQSKKMSKIFREYAEFQSRFGEKVKKGSKKSSKKANKMSFANQEESDQGLNDSVRKTMEKRYENTLESLESQNANEKQQLNAMHQQRVLTLINMKKQEATDCYTNALNQFPLRIKKIQKCLEKLMKSLEKDRVHTLHHYRHLLLVNPKLAAKEKQATLTHLENLIVIANRSISMLSKYPNVNDKIHNHIVAFWHNLRGVSFDQQISRETEASIIDKYEREIVQATQEKAKQKALQLQQIKRAEQQQKEQHSVTLTSTSTTSSVADTHRFAADDHKSHAVASSVAARSHENLHAVETNEADSTEHERRLALEQSEHNTDSAGNSFAPIPANMQRSAAHHSASFVISEQKPEAHYLTQVKPKSRSQATSAVITIAGAAVAVALVAGIVLYRANSSQSPLSQGFVAVQQHQPSLNSSNSAEAQHVEALQINGYENPTYKFFENQTA